MTRKSIFTLMAVCLMFFGLSAQNLQSNIPKDATFVVTLNPSVLNSKVKFSKLKEFDFVRKGIEEMTKQAGPMAAELKKFIDDPAQLGMDMMSSSYAFGKVDGKNVHMAYALKIADKTKFEELINTYAAAMFPIKSENNMQYISADGVNFSWDNNQILISGVELEYDEGEEYQAHKERKEREAMTWMKNIMSGSNASNSIMTHPKFKMAEVNKDDVNFFADYETFSKLSQDLQGGADPMTEMMMQSMSGMYKDSYISMGLNFDKGTTKFTSEYFMNDAMMDLYRKISNATFNKNFLKYLPKDNLGYFSFNFNLDNLIDAIKTSESPMLAQYPVYESMAVEGLKSVGLEMTADDLYKLWNGDIMLVVTGMKEFEKEVTTYEFDDDFNKQEVKEMKKETLPEFIMMMSHKNKDGLLQLIEFGKQSSMISDQNGIFQVSVPDMPMDIFMKVDKGMMLISNNMDIVKKKAKKVFKRKNLLKGAEIAKIMNSSSIFHWNIPETMNVLSEMEGMRLKGEEELLFNMSKDSFKSLVFETDKNISNSVNAEMRLNFNNGNMNSLEQIFTMINDVFVSMGGGGSSM